MSSPTKVIQAMAGSIRKFFDMSSSGPIRRAPAPSREPSEHDQSRDQDIADNSSNEPVKTIEEQMEDAKKMYPGSKNWAREEERLFKVLYLRQDIPILPSHWNVDFRGFPIPEAIFETDEEYPPRVYAHLRNNSKEYTATAALTKLIDLTLSVRTLIESEHLDQKTLRRRAAELIKDSIEGYLSWAAHDGGYANQKVLPNIVVEVVDARDTQAGIVAFMDSRMKALGRLQREFYRTDRQSTFWKTIEPWTMATDAQKRKTLKNKRRTRHARRKYTQSMASTPDLGWDELSSPTTGVETPLQSLDVGHGKQRTIKGSPTEDRDELADSYDALQPSIESDGDSLVSGTSDVNIKSERLPTPQLSILHNIPPSLGSSKLTFRRQPPVVYGLYVIGTSVILLTTDSSKGETGYVSFHVDINFSDAHQSVWNALTVALAVCAARDDVMTRLDDFDMASVVEHESDPDA